MWLKCEIANSKLLVEYPTRTWEKTETLQSFQSFWELDEFRIEFWILFADEFLCARCPRKKCCDQRSLICCGQGPRAAWFSSLILPAWIMVNLLRKQWLHSVTYVLATWTVVFLFPVHCWALDSWILTTTTYSLSTLITVSEVLSSGYLLSESPSSSPVYICTRCSH